VIGDEPLLGQLHHDPGGVGCPGGSHDRSSRRPGRRRRTGRRSWRRDRRGLRGWSGGRGRGRGAAPL